jgi:predicted RNA-binding protein with PUA-like domain
MNHWLMKSEPNDFSFNDLRNSPGKKTHWDGVRNYQARNFMRDHMKKNDLVFFYHSNTAEPGIVGIAKVSRESYPDHTAFDPKDKHYDPKSDPKNPRWLMVDISYERKLKNIITLSELRKYSDAQLNDLTLLRRGNRLSISPVSAKEWGFISSLERSKY